MVSYAGPALLDGAIKCYGAITAVGTTFDATTMPITIQPRRPGCLAQQQSLALMPSGLPERSATRDPLQVAYDKCATRMS